MKLALTLLVSTITTTSGWALSTYLKQQNAEDFEIQDGKHEGNGIYCKYFIKESVLRKNCTKLVAITNVPINQKFDGTESWTDHDCESKAKYDRGLETTEIVSLVLFVLVSFLWICMMCVSNLKKKLEGEEGQESPEPAVNLEEIEPGISSDLPPPSYQQATVFGNQTQS